MDRYTLEMQYDQYPENPLDWSDELFHLAALNERYIGYENTKELRYLCEENSHRMNAEDRYLIDQAEYSHPQELIAIIEKYNLAILEIFSTQYCDYVIWMDYPTVKKEYGGVNKQIKERARSYIESWAHTMKAYYEGDVHRAIIHDTLYGEDVEECTFDGWAAYGWNDYKALEKHARAWVDRKNAEWENVLAYTAAQEALLKQHGTQYMVGNVPHTIRVVWDDTLTQYNSLDESDMGAHYIVINGCLQFVSLDTQVHGEALIAYGEEYE